MTLEANLGKNMESHQRVTIRIATTMDGPGKLLHAWHSSGGHGGRPLGDGNRSSIEFTNADSKIDSREP